MTSSIKLFSFDFAGKVEAVLYHDDFPDGRPIAKDDSIIGTITYDLNAQDKYSNSKHYPRTAFYEMNPKDEYYGITATINGNEFLTNPDRVLVYNNEEVNNYGDRIIFSGTMVENPDFRGKEPSFPFGLNSGFIKWDLQNELMTAISSKELPTAINLNDWPVNKIRILGERYDSDNAKPLYNLEIIGTIESVIPAAPAPPTGLRFV